MLFAFKMTAQYRYEIKHGNVRFHSEAPSEFISAYSSRLSGNVDLKNKTFSFKIFVSSFKGFNCTLLRLHFNANCMESLEYPDATFVGNIIDDVDVSKDGDYVVRAKGRLKIHGIEQSRIVKVHITSKNGQISFDARMPVVFNEYNIRIPKVWVKRMAAEVLVDVSGTMLSSSDKLTYK